MTDYVVEFTTQSIGEVPLISINCIKSYIQLNDQDSDVKYYLRAANLGITGSGRFTDRIPCRPDQAFISLNKKALPVMSRSAFCFQNQPL